jgi:hypothetical protein
MEKVYLNVSYEQKDVAKSLGARWDPERKMWYAPDDSFKKLIETFSPSKPKKETPKPQKPQIKINKQNYVKLVGENAAFKEKELSIDLLPKTTGFSIFDLSKDDFYRLKDTLNKRAAYMCEICQSECTGRNISLCERYSYHDDVQKLERIQVLCGNCFQTIRLKDKTTAIQWLQTFNKISEAAAIEQIRAGYELWRQRSDIRWNTDVSLLTNSGIHVEKKESVVKSIDNSSVINDKVKKISIHYSKPNEDDICLF